MTDHRPSEPTPRDYKETPDRRPPSPADAEPTQGGPVADESAAHPS